MRFLAMAAVAAAVVLPGAALAAAGWQVIENKAGAGYRVELPGQAVEQATPGSESGPIQAKTYTVDRGATAVAFTVMEVDEAVASQAEPTMIVNAGLDGAIREMKSVEVSRRDVTLKGGAPAREVKFTSPPGEEPAYSGRAVAAMKGSRIIFIVSVVENGAPAAETAENERSIGTMEFLK